MHVGQALSWKDGVVLVVDMELVLENESGLELLEFLEQNALTVANTWFSKKRPLANLAASIF